MLPYSVSCSYPPALWSWKTKESLINSLHRNTSDSQSRTKNIHRLVEGMGKKGGKMDVSTELANWSISVKHLVTGYLGKQKRTAYVPQVLCCL